MSKKDMNSQAGSRISSYRTCLDDVVIYGSVCAQSWGNLIPDMEEGSSK